MKSENIISFKKLSEGLLTEIYKRSLEEPEYLAIHSQTATLGYYYKRWQYVNEVKRVLLDLELVIALMKECYDKTLLDKLGANEEDVLVFYQGYYLDLVHQMKDKISKMIYFLDTAIDEKDPITTKELKKHEGTEGSDKKVAKLIPKLSCPELKSLLSVWDENGDVIKNDIIICLKRRTQYHHKISGIHLNEEFSRIKAFRTILNYSGLLSEQKKTFIKEAISKELLNFTILSQKKAEKTFQEILDNVEKTAEIFVKKYNFSDNPTTTVEIFNKYLELEDSFKVINISHESLIQSPMKDFLTNAVELAKKYYKSNLLSVYLVGSVGRGQYEHGQSNLNLYILLKNGAGELDKETLKKLKEIRNEIKIINFSDFLKDDFKKDRFICIFDGVLLFGKEMPKEEFPRSGAELTYLMNKDLPKDLKYIREWCNDKLIVKNITDISEKAQYISNQIIHYLYGIVDANHPGAYTFSRRTRTELILKYYPKHKKLISTLNQVRYSKVRTCSELMLIINALEPNIIKNIEKLERAIVGSKSSERGGFEPPIQFPE
jgi:hypothetical protein